MKQQNWKPAGKVDLRSLEDRLPAGKRLVTGWLPGVGACYMIVSSSKPHWKSKTPKPKAIY